ncbi:hypothetical protein [Flavobacterium aciduliphilum]|uniref:Uncharacterized protein n=1 Tax=Flavobacterium aciduliphilum TaxID=1101402 RepID=A0A328YYR3_9FLAO|nr:hypothetical protein [Flavobacterium aciduliphilum]RAR75687.1 hypothetical protein CLV55_101387 [Flavobacterium aciduliphilum]
MNLINRIDSLKSEEIKIVFKELMTDYFSPAFGSISKRDLDILLFTKLQKLGLISDNPEMYELISELRVTRAKARNLLYESKLRQSTTKQLDAELINYLSNPIFLKENDKIGLEIGNPYLIDYLKDKLKKLNHITDGSFSPELIKLTPDAFVALFDSYIPEESKKQITEALVTIGAKADTSWKGFLKGVFKKLGTKIADKAGEEIAENIVDYLSPFFTSDGVSKIQEKFKDLYSNA